VPFKDLPPEEKEKVYAELKNFVWATVVKAATPEKEDYGYLILALSPTFMEKLFEGAKGWEEELGPLFGKIGGNFTASLARIFEETYSGFPIQRESLVLLSLMLRRLSRDIARAEKSYRRSIIAERGEQNLPGFLIDRDSNPEK
jgi:hypothetical protein